MFLLSLEPGADVVTELEKRILHGVVLLGAGEGDIFQISNGGVNPDIFAEVAVFIEGDSEGDMLIVLDDDGVAGAGLGLGIAGTALALMGNGGIPGLFGGCYNNGNGSGVGDGSGYRDGSGDGSGYGEGIKSINNHCVYTIDGLETLIYRVWGNVAKGAILNGDLTLTPCFVVKNGNTFAHGKTIPEAVESLNDKMFDDMSIEDRIDKFIESHPNIDAVYPNQDLFDWHNKLTGSCEMGRNAFMRNNGLTLDGKTSVRDFIELTQYSFGGNVIKQLKSCYERGT